MARPGDLLAGVEPELEPGFTLGGRYRIERKIGRGGMGTVYAAHHLALGRKVALKVIARQHVTDARQLERFRREARVASQLRHPNIVEVIDLGSAQGQEYIAMEFLEGVDLCDAIQLAGNYEPTDTVPILDQVLQALEVAHDAGLVHRDLKPENIYLAQTPSGEIVVKLLDFGVVKVPDEGGEAQLTRTGTVVGTPEYMAPEQATGGVIDGRADLYALGCIAHAMVCGRPPFVGKSVLLLMAAHVRETPPKPSSVRRGLRAADAVDAFIAGALEKDPRLRYPTAQVMRNALAQLAEAIGESDLRQRRISLPSAKVRAADVMAALSDTDRERMSSAMADAPPTEIAPPPLERPESPTHLVERPRPRAWLWLLAGLVIGSICGAAAAYFALKHG